MDIDRGKNMDINELNELIDDINEAYNEFVEQNRGERYAIARLFDEFDTMGSEDIDDIITNMAIGELIIKQDSVFIGNLQCIKKSLMNFDNLKNELKTEITEKELNNIESRIKKVLEMLDTMKVTTDPNC